MADNVALGQVLSVCLDFPCRLSTQKIISFLRLKSETGVRDHLRPKYQRNLNELNLTPPWDTHNFSFQYELRLSKRLLLLERIVDEYVCVSGSGVDPSCVFDFETLFSKSYWNCVLKLQSKWKMDFFSHINWRLDLIKKELLCTIFRNKALLLCV